MAMILAYIAPSSETGFTNCRFDWRVAPGRAIVSDKNLFSFTAHRETATWLFAPGRALARAA